LTAFEMESLDLFNSIIFFLFRIILPVSASLKVSVVKAFKKFN